MPVALILLVALSMFNPRMSALRAQGTTAFTYQGQLRDGGTNANGTYTMIFKLYDAISNGNLIGSAITNNPTLANGLFTTSLDFGPGAFDGNARWLEITITNGPDTQTLSPRVQVLPAPYAQYAAIAATVTNGAINSAQLAPGAVADSNISSTTALLKSISENNLQIVRGTINANGVAVEGQGFTVNVTSSTTRTINFAIPFSANPTVALGQHGSSGNSVVDLVSSSAGSFSTVANGSAGFEFIAIGPK